MTIPYRREKLSSQIVRDVAEILQQELKDPRMGFVTVTRVVVSPDFKYARVFVSIMGAEKEKKLTMSALGHAVGFVQRQLSRRLRLRQVPEVSFTRDDSIDKAFKVTEMIEKLSRERKARGGDDEAGVESGSGKEEE